MTPLTRDSAAPQGGAPHIDNRQRLDGWLARIAAAGDGTRWLVGRAMVICLRENRGGAVPLRRLSVVAKLPLKVVAAVIYSLRAAGRLQFTRTGNENDTRFNFTIPTPALESAWIDQRRRA